MADTLADVKYKVAVANRVLWALDLATGVTASLGHASMRVLGQPARFLAKGRGYQLDALAAAFQGPHRPRLRAAVGGRCVAVLHR